jgi:hypothetical protein
MQLWFRDRQQAVNITSGQAEACGSSLEGKLICGES